MYNEKHLGVQTLIQPQEQPTVTPDFSFIQDPTQPLNQSPPPGMLMQVQYMPQPTNCQQTYFYGNQPIVQGQELPAVQMQNITLLMTEHSMPPQQPQLPGQVVIAQPVEIRPNLPSQVRSRHPREIFCAQCQKQGVTNIKNVIGNGTYATALALFCIGCWPCAALPFCLPDCMDTHHTCSRCGADAGRKQFLFD